jgi:hypothetical protein
MPAGGSRLPQWPKHGDKDRTAGNVHKGTLVFVPFTYVACSIVYHSEE